MTTAPYAAGGWLSFARIISYVFNPLLMPVWAFLLMFSLDAYFSLIIPWSAKRSLLLVVIINAALLPLLAIIVLKRLGLVSSLDLDKREERLYPLLLGIIMYYLTYHLFSRLNLPDIYTVFLLGASLIAAGGLVVSLFYKISIHMAAVGGLFGLVLAMAFAGLAAVEMWIPLTLVVCGLTGSARLLLQAHTPTQVYLGFLMGSGMMLISFLVF